MCEFKKLFSLIYHVFSVELLVTNFIFFTISVLLATIIIRNSRKEKSRVSKKHFTRTSFHVKGSRIVRSRSLKKIKRSNIRDLQCEIKSLKREKLIVDNLNQEFLMECLTRNLSDNKNWESFRREFKETYPAFYDSLNADFPELTESNRRILLLKKLDFNNEEIAEYLNLTPAAIVKSLQRMKLKLGDRYIELIGLINQKRL